MNNKQRYLENGRECPFCGGTDLAAVSDRYYGEGDFVSKPPRISTAMSCENCGKDWFDIYQLVDIEVAEDVERTEDSIDA